MLWVPPHEPIALDWDLRPCLGPHHMVTCPSVTPVLRYFLEYQWFVDFAVYSTAVYIFTEGYYCLADPEKETNMGVLWCLLTVVFSMYPPAGFRGAMGRRQNPPSFGGFFPIKSQLRWKIKMSGFLNLSLLSCKAA